jgi:hypothetical protein
MNRSFPFRFPRSNRSATQVGYSTTTRLLLHLREFFRPQHYYLWFSTSLNSRTIGGASRPLNIYERLTEDVSANDYHAQKIKDLRAGYLVAIRNQVGSAELRAEMFVKIALADIESFSPVLLKLDLTGLDLVQFRQNAVDKGASAGDRDEYLALDLQPRRVAVIVE